MSDKEQGVTLLQLRWGVRRWAALIVAAALAMGALAVLVQRLDDKTYSAEALVVASQSAVQLEVLPRLGEAVFNSGAVARSVADLPEVATPPQDVIPDVLALQVQQDSITYKVTGRSEDPVQAAAIANTGATAFTTELNRAGTGVGTFIVQSQAVPPANPESGGPGLVGTILAGALAGLSLALGVVAALIVIRRPVVSAAQVTDIVPVPHLGTVTIGRSAEHRPADAPGLLGLVRRLGTADLSSVALTSPMPNARAYRHLIPALTRAFGVMRQERRAGRESGVDAQPDLHALVVPDVGPSDLVNNPVLRGRVVLVVPEGIASASLQRFTDDLVPGDVFGTVLVRPRSALSRPRRRHAESQPRPQLADAGSARERSRSSESRRSASISAQRRQGEVGAKATEGTAS